MKLAGLVAAALLAAAVPAAQPGKPKITRDALSVVERSFDQRITKLGQNDPFDLLGNTRGVYLNDYGVVFTTELNLIVTPIMTPFRPAISKPEVEQVRQRKLQRLALLKQAMRDMLVASAANLGALPPDEQVVCGVTLFYFPWEERDGLPSQILMHASKSALLNGSGDALVAALRVEEF
jgi:hypothetical protein